MAKEKILIVDDEPMIRWTLNEALRGWEYDSVEVGTVAAALASFEAERPAAVLLDINLPDGSGLDALREIKKRRPQAVVIMITANVLLEDTIAALRGGAYDFIGKPVNLNELQVTIRNGIEAGKLRKEVNSMRRDLAREFSFDQIVGESPAMKKMIQLAHKVAESEASSVIQIDLPPLRERGDDVLQLTDHYIKNFNEKLRKRIRGVTPEVAEIFRRYGWPGNVREMRNVIERAMILEDDDLITTSWLPRGVTPEAQIAAQPQEAVATWAKAAAQKSTDTSLDDPFRLPPEGVELESVEMSLVEQAMKRSGGNQTRAAELLGISRDQLRYRLKKLEEAAAAGAIN